MSHDAEKRVWTLAERGIDFADAAAIFAGPTITLEDDRFDYPEPRYQTYGLLAERLVLMVWTPTETGIRAISMRHCHDKEARRVTPHLG